MSEVAARKPRGVTIELVGVPEHVLAAFQANASDDPEEVEAAKQRLRERNGADYRFDPEKKLFERLPAVVHAPQRRENAAQNAAPPAAPAMRPRERRARRASTTSRASPDDPSEPEPSPLEVWHGLAAASEGLQRHLERRSAPRRATIA
jgi:hypothetical protein